MRAHATFSAALAILAGAAACTPDAPLGPEPPAATTAADAGSEATTAAAAAAPEPAGDPAAGRLLVAQFQCNRCHDGLEHGAAPRDAHCVHCHQDIAAGKFDAPAAAMSRWQDNLVELRDVPSLAAIGDRVRRGFIRDFLLNPRDLRPRLHATMPRLAISPEQARDIAAYLTQNRHDRQPVSLDDASAAHGRELYEAKGCGSCHVFTGVADLPGPKPVATMEKETRAAVALAPDLRFSRDRAAPADLVAWLLDPASIKPGTPMPLVPLTPAEARDVAAFLVTTPLSPPPPVAPRERLPILSRRVTYDEVNRRVFRNTCRHCHSEPDYALGDGGPGNTGGFGFKPRGLNLGSYEGIAAGYLDEQGQRRSVFAPLSDGRPRLLAALVARQSEESGTPDPEARGMPLGLPALGSEEIQLVETWIAQGRPQ